MLSSGVYAIASFALGIVVSVILILNGEPGFAVLVALLSAAHAQHVIDNSE